jgi:hypothetical protein
MATATATKPPLYSLASAVRSRLKDRELGVGSTEGARELKISDQLLAMKSAVSYHAGAIILPVRAE